jgi:putative transposase
MQINRKKVWRLWREESLQVATRTRRKRAGESTAPEPPLADAPNRVWGIDFQHDATRDGRGFKIASMVDEHTRESLLDLTKRSIAADALTVELDRIIAERRAPTMRRCDNGPEFISQVLKEFCRGHETKISYIPPCQPWKNAWAESLNNRGRDECLNMNDFNDLLHAQVMISDWKCEYNARHRHSNLGYLTPREYAQRYKH